MQKLLILWFLFVVPYVTLPYSLSFAETKVQPNKTVRSDENTTDQSSSENGLIDLRGFWIGPYGVLQFFQKGHRIIAKVFRPSEECSYPIDTVIIDGVMEEDSLSGKIRPCYKDTACIQKNKDQWLYMMLLVVNKESISGVVQNMQSECRQAIKGGVIKLIKTSKKDVISKKEGPIIIGNAGGYNPINKKTYGDLKAILKEAKAYLEEGYFERARKLFLKALEKDPQNPVIYNGIGVTYYARRDFQEAMRWYKKSIDVNPEFGDGYYNIACIYSLLGKKNLAIKYLKIALLNGYVSLKAMEEDPDLNSIRDEPEYKELIKQLRSLSR